MKRFIFLLFLVSHIEISICEQEEEYKCTVISEPEKPEPDVIVWESDYEKEWSE
jgi:hypothetical protein